MARIVVSRLCVALLPSLAASGALADAFSVGLGAGGSHGNVDCKTSLPCDRSGSAFSAFVEDRFDSGVAIRLGVVEGGRFRGSDDTPLGDPFGGTFRVRGGSLSAGYHWEFAPDWSLEGHAGATVARTVFSYSSGAFEDVGKTILQPLAGVGVDYALTRSVSLGVGYDITRFKVHATRGSLQTLGLRAQYRF